MLTDKMSAGVAPDVNLKYPLNACNERSKQSIQPGFKNRTDTHKSPKEGYNLNPQKGLMS